MNLRVHRGEPKICYMHLLKRFFILGYGDWGVIVLTVGFAWKLYTIWLLVNLHEAVHGTHFSRYLRLAIASFGNIKKKSIKFIRTLSFTEDFSF